MRLGVVGIREMTVFTPIASPSVVVIAKISSIPLRARCGWIKQWVQCMLLDAFRCGSEYKNIRRHFNRPNGEI